MRSCSFWRALSLVNISTSTEDLEVPYGLAMTHYYNVLDGFLVLCTLLMILVER